MPDDLNIDLLRKIAISGHKIIRRNIEYGRVAIPYLHFLSAHQNNLHHYKSIIYNSSNTKKLIYNFCSQIGLIIKSMCYRNSDYFGDCVHDEIDVLFVSHFLREQDAHQKNDIYFGSVPQDLKNMDVRTFTVLIDHAKIPWRKLRSKWISYETKRAILSTILGLKMEINFARSLNSSAKALRKERDEEQDPHIKKLLHNAAIDAGSPNCRTAMRIGEHIKRVVTKTKPKIIITTFEGHSWERLAFAKAREVNPNILCIGYHHAVIFPIQYAMMSSLDFPYDPDFIFTAGEISKEYFLKVSRYNDTKIDSLGSCRGAFSAPPVERPQTQKQCLILPEGIISESLSMIGLAIEAAKKRHDIKFIIRLHPLLNFETLINLDKSLEDLPENVNWSNQSLEEDCRSSRWAIYRGSSAIIAAILSGIQPIYYSQERDELQIDPIKSLRTWRTSIKNCEELISSFAQDLNRTEEDRDNDFREAQSFALKYFTSFETDKIIKLLEDT